MKEYDIVPGGTKSGPETIEWGLSGTLIDV